MVAAIGGGKEYRGLDYSGDPPVRSRRVDLDPCEDSRAMALIQEPAAIDKILEHLREKGRGARAGPWATGRP